MKNVRKKLFMKINYYYINYSERKLFLIFIAIYYDAFLFPNLISFNKYFTVKNKLKMYRYIDVLITCIFMIIYK